MSASSQEITASPFEDGIEPATLIELLQYRASHQPEQVAYTFLDELAVPSASLTYREVDQRARAIAARLQQMKAVNERVLLLYTAGLEFHVAFLGCLYAGAIAVPAYPPKMNRTFERLRALIADAEARIILTTTPILSRLRPSAEQLFDLKSFQWLATDDVQTDSEEWRNPGTASSALAFLQYTSGSTGTPRGVRLTHANLLHNARLVYEAVEHSPTDKYVSWLPTFHDMGFMAGVLQPLYARIPAVLISPTSFLQNPSLWLHAISAHKATISGGPNFAYRLCVTHVSVEQRAAINLESWTVAFNGAEPIHAQTLDDFAATFAPCGFDKQAFYPCYGLAEATLMVSGGRKTDAPIQKHFIETALKHHRVVEADVPDHDSRTLVSCGRALGGQRIAIVEPVAETICRSDEVGEIWISGPSVADGYWRQTEQSNRVFGAYLKPTGEGPFLRTGDLGFLQNGQLYITGRLKDLIIIRGANYYPHDIELTVQKSDPVLRAGCGAAFSVEIDGAERLVVVQEVDKQKTHDSDDLVAIIRRDISREHELQAYSIVLIKRGTIPKTSSGKIQRYACKAAFLSGALDEV
ncbi:MAG TPA: fatty acyl-AMP ligase, partial [Pyrinomonadaceae bacterium]|nr:fatty acyl-AMP ligase [Pyrinomonadaceae bacterium]